MTANTPSEWTLICHVDDIPRLGARRVARAAGPEVAIFRTGDDRIFALLDRCPHRGGPLSQGIVTAEGVHCPLHNFHIGFADGCARAPDEGCTPRFSVQVESGAVMLDAAELRMLAVGPDAQTEPVPA